MNKKTNFKKWIFLLFVTILAIIVVLVSLAYIIDPFFQFRVKDNKYMLTGRFVSPGLIKNYEYDTLILGSSMTQNFRSSPASVMTIWRGGETPCRRSAGRSAGSSRTVPKCLSVI